MTFTQGIEQPGEFFFAKNFFPRLEMVMKSAVAVAGILASTQIKAQVLTIDVGAQTLQDNTANQTLSFFVNNSSGSPVAVTGLNFNLQIGDGTVGPTITAVDLLTGTPFASNNTGQGSTGSSPHQAFWATTTSSGSVNLTPGLNKVATVTFDSTSLNSGSWGLFLGATDNGATAYLDTSPIPNDIPMTINEGSLTIVPEPGSYAVVAALSCLAFGIVARRSRS